MFLLLAVRCRRRRLRLPHDEDFVVIFLDHVGGEEGVARFAEELGIVHVVLAAVAAVAVAVVLAAVLAAVLAVAVAVAAAVVAAIAGIATAVDVEIGTTGETAQFEHDVC